LSTECYLQDEALRQSEVNVVFLESFCANESGAILADRFYLMEDRPIGWKLVYSLMVRTTLAVGRLSAVEVLIVFRIISSYTVIVVTANFGFMKTTL
jgi:hypothetical protein